MRITIKGTYRKCPREELREAVKFAVKELLPKEILKNLHITLIIKKDIPWYAEMEQYSQSTYTIWLSGKLTKKWMISSIFHELTHVKQYITGQMKDLNPDGSKVIWNSRILEYNEDDHLDRDYYRSPWEVEAYGREFTLWKLWKRRKAIERAENKSRQSQKEGTV